MDMGPVLTQMGILVFTMALGFFCTKIGVTGPEFTRSSSKVVINVLMVFTIFNSVASAEMELSLADVGMDLLAFVAMFAVCGVVAFIAPRLLRLGSEKRGIAEFSICFTNTVFVGFPIIESVYGDEGVLVAALSNIPFNVLAYSLGIAMLSGSTKGMRFRNILSAPLVSTVIAMAWFLTGWELPAVVSECFGTIGSATAPMSMLVVGASLGAMNVKQTLGDWRVYILSFVRLIICPVAVWLLLRPFVDDAMLLGVTMILASCPVAMVATALAIQAGRDEAYTSQCIFITTVFSAVTMPLLIWLLL